MQSSSNRLLARVKDWRQPLRPTSISDMYLSAQCSGRFAATRTDAGRRSRLYLQQQRLYYTSSLFFARLSNAARSNIIIISIVYKKQPTGRHCIAIMSSSSTSASDEGYHLSHFSGAELPYLPSQSLSRSARGQNCTEWAARRLFLLPFGSDDKQSAVTAATCTYELCYLNVLFVHSSYVR